MSVPHAIPGALTSTAPARRYLVGAVDGTLHGFEARDVLELGGRTVFLTGRVFDDVPEIAAWFRSSHVAWWRSGAEVIDHRDAAPLELLPAAWVATP